MQTAGCSGPHGKPLARAALLPATEIQQRNGSESHRDSESLPASNSIGVEELPAGCSQGVLSG